jgi:hypothetical protein
MDIGILIPILAILMGPVMYWMYLKEVKLKRSHQLEDGASEQNGARITELEQRVRVLERILTDGGVQTAAQIEALREPAPTLVREREKVS